MWRISHFVIYLGCFRHNHDSSLFSNQLVFLGLIATVSGNRKGSNDIALVESLVTSYIKKPSCIILLTVTCESKLPYLFLPFIVLLSCVQLADFENQGATRLTKLHDPEGKRTVGTYFQLTPCLPTLTIIPRCPHKT